MAIDLTVKSNAITNREATPSVANSPGQGGASKVKVVSGYLASVTAALSIGSIIRMVDVPSNAVIHEVLFQSAAQGAGSFDIGVYRNNKDGGLVVDADLFAAAVDCTSAVVITDETNQSTNNTIAKQSQPLWQAAGLTEDPKSSLDICLTVAAVDVTTGTGAVGLLAAYSD